MATGTQVLRAYSKAVKKMEGEMTMSATEVSAGFIEVPNPPRKRGMKKYQVFVKVCRYSEDLFKRRPQTGGLLVNA